MLKQLEFERKFIEKLMNGFRPNESKSHMLMMNIFGKKYKSEQLILLCKAFDIFIQDPSYEGTHLSMSLSREIYRRKQTALRWFEENLNQINELLTSTCVMAEFADNTYEQIQPFGSQQVPFSKKIVRLSNSHSLVEVDDNWKVISKRKGCRSHQEKVHLMNSIETSNTPVFFDPSQQSCMTVVNPDVNPDVNTYGNSQTEDFYQTFDYSGETPSYDNSISLDDLDGYFDDFQALY